MNTKDALALATNAMACTVHAVDREAKKVQLQPCDIAIPLNLIPENFRSTIEQGHAIRLFLVIESRHTRQEWSRAFALQGQSDLRVYEILNKDTTVAASHKLHYLQTAAEKLAKAHAMSSQKSDKTLDTLTSRHQGASISEFVKTYFMSSRGKTLIKNQKGDVAREIASDLEKLASEIEKCQPAVDKEKNPQNVEYPWSDGRQIFVPCEQRWFLDDFKKNIWIELFDLLKTAGDALVNKHSGPS